MEEILTSVSPPGEELLGFIQKRTGLSQDLTTDSSMQYLLTGSLDPRTRKTKQDETRRLPLRDYPNGGTDAGASEFREDGSIGRPPTVSGGPSLSHWIS